jgi:hypothetical protein
LESRMRKFTIIGDKYHDNEFDISYTQLHTDTHTHTRDTLQAFTLN